MNLPRDIISTIAGFDPVLQYSLYPHVHVKCSPSFLYNAIVYGFTDVFIDILRQRKVTLSPDDIQDCYEVAFIHKDWDCIEALKNIKDDVVIE